MEPESFNIDDYVKDGKLNLTEKTYRKYDKEFIATKIIDKILEKHPYLKNIKLVNNIEDKSTTNIVNKIKNS